MILSVIYLSYWAFFCDFVKKDKQFKTKIWFKTIYNYTDKKIINARRKDLVYGNYEKEEKTEAEVTKLNKVGKQYTIDQKK